MANANTTWGAAWAAPGSLAADSSITVPTRLTTDATLTSASTVPALSACSAATRRSWPWSAERITAATSARYSHTATFQPTSARVTAAIAPGTSSATAMPTTTAVARRAWAPK